MALVCEVCGQPIPAGTIPEPLPFEPPIDVVNHFYALTRAADPRKVLEAGTSQAVPGRSTHSRNMFPAVAEADYVKMDVAGGPDVDVVADLHAMPAEWSGRFDAFVANAVWEHLERPWIAAREVFRVLSPGGLFLVHTHQTYPIHGYPKDFFRFSREALRLIFEDAGFVVEASEHRLRCLIIPPSSFLPPEAVLDWNLHDPSFIAVAACGRKPG
jgi:SAM-dependent methyltransferase